MAATAASGKRRKLTLGTLTATSVITPAMMARHILFRMEQCSKSLLGSLPVVLMIQSFLRERERECVCHSDATLSAVYGV